MRSSIVFPLLALLVGCGGIGPGPEPPQFSVGVVADWPPDPASREVLGYVLTVLVIQRAQDGACPALSEHTRVLINGAPVSFFIDPDDATGCKRGGFELGPYLEEQSVTVVVEELGQIVDMAVFENLMPGAAATLEAPSELHAGDEIVIRPVPDVPAKTGHAAFYPLDEPVWQPWGVSGTTERRSDGLHVTVPAFTGRAVLAVWGTFGTILNAESTCPGFAVCYAESADVLGPFFVTGAP